MLRLAEFTSNEGDALLLYLSIVTESTHPDHLRLAAEPGHLAFGVVALGLLSCLQCGFPIDFPSQKLDCLFIAQRSQRARRIAVFLQEACGFLDQTRREHLLGTLINTRIERIAIRIETEPKNVEALERLPPMLPQLSHFLPGGQTNFDGANELGRVIRVNASGCRGIRSLQHAMQVRRSLFCGALAQALTASFRTVLPGAEPLQPPAAAQASGQPREWRASNARG